MRVSEDTIWGYTFLFVGAEEYYVWLDDNLQTSKITYSPKSSKVLYYNTTIVNSPAEYVKRKLINP